MKIFLKIIYLTLFLIIGCNPDNMDMIMNEMSMEKEMEEEMETEFNGFSQGDFVSDAHTTTGVASINNSKTTLSLTNFKTDDGPKLLVYLSTDKNSTDFVNLGDLKAISGNQNYAIPSNTDLDKYNIVSIWCVDFSVSFGHAELK